jgi:hypothetical protein
LGSLASVNPLLAQMPSQNGLVADPPHRHNATWGGTGICSPR